jgi:hypothetical protein
MDIVFAPRTLLCDPSFCLRPHSLVRIKVSFHRQYVYAYLFQYVSDNAIFYGTASHSGPAGQRPDTVEKWPGPVYNPTHSSSLPVDVEFRTLRLNILTQDCSHCTPQPPPVLRSSALCDERSLHSLSAPLFTTLSEDIQLHVSSHI